LKRQEEKERGGTTLLSSSKKNERQRKKESRKKKKEGEHNTAGLYPKGNVDLPKERGERQGGKNGEKMFERFDPQTQGRVVLIGGPEKGRKKKGFNGELRKRRGWARTACLRPTLNRKKKKKENASWPETLRKKKTVSIKTQKKN